MIVFDQKLILIYLSLLILWTIDIILRQAFLTLENAILS